MRSNNTYIPITNSVDIEIYDEEKSNWISGNIEIRRLDYDKENKKYISYIFKSFDRKQIFNLEGKDLRVRILLIQDI